MSGLDQIIQSILDAAQKESDEILQAAKEKADSILQAADRDVAALELEAEENIKKETQKLQQMAAAADQQNRRQILLKTKLDVIGQCIRAARDKILTMPDAEYFDMLYQLFENQHIEKDGEILFSEKDKERLPDDFIARLNTVSDGKIALSDECINIEGGFVVRCGQIEINCTIDSILSEKESILQDRLNKYLSEE